MSKKPITTVVTISRLGVYDAKRKVFFWGDWMRSEHNRKVYVLSDLFSNNSIHVHAADTNEYLGMANIKNSKPLVISRKTATSDLFSFCNSTQGDSYAH